MQLEKENAMTARRNLKTLSLTSVCTVFLCLPGGVFGRTFYVDDDAAGAQDGTCWTGAFKYLQDALAVVVAGDEIRVAQGEYLPDRGGGSTAGDRNATFRVPDGVAIKGGFAGVGATDPDLRDIALFATVLTGDLAGNDDPNDQSTWSDNSFPVVTADGVSHDTVLEGLTIAHAYDYRKREAALYNEGGNLVVRDCTFRDNGADSGSAGVYNHQGNLRIEHCRFTHNWTENHAAALHNDQGAVEVIASEFVENECGDGTSGVLNDEGQAVFFGCLFRANRSASGMGVLSSIGEMSLLYCTFIDNSALENTAGVSCGGQARIANCLFSGNRGEVGALKVGGCVSLQQCTFYGNSSWGEGKEDAGLAGALRAPDTFRPDGSTVTACGCIFWGNRNLRDDVTGYDAQITGDPNLVTLEYCCIEGWTPEYGGTGNLGTDPLFVAPDQNDFHLKSQAGHWDAPASAWVADDVTSPCIDAGDPNGPLGQEPFPNGGIVNIGVYGGTCEASKSWFGAEPGPGIEAADLNGDGRVDAEDLRLAMLRQSQSAPVE
jgi:hypothetical protein